MFFATFNEGPSQDNAEASHARAMFRYSRAEMEGFGESAGWSSTYIGDWNHPRKQMMMRYEKT